MVQPETGLVIEGFPRSGNTFAVVAFRMAQERSFHVAHHLHAQAQVIRAVKWRIPVCLLIREPIEAVKSLVVKLPFIRLGDALRVYWEFYSDLRPFRDQMVVARFEEVTQDFGGVIERINRKFGTDFKRFVHTPGNVEKVFTHMKQSRRATFAGSSGVAMPHEDKKREKDKLDFSGCGELVERAERAYRDFLVGDGAE
jgi:hypothetical protein